MGKHNDFGRLGEEIAADFLVKKGYQICHTNYRYQKAEIDIVALKGNILAIVEVKSRSSDQLQEIAETVSRKKIKLLVAAADDYVLQNNLDVEVRFDIITLLKKNNNFVLEHLEDAFYHF
ncbi:MAG: YraN family protein [Bacteroidota bacterium]